MKRFFLAIAALMAMVSIASGQVVQGSGVGSSLRVTVLDQTDAALIIAQVTIVDSRGVEQTKAVDDRGVAIFEGLDAGNYQVKAAADSFRPITTPVTVRRGENRTTLRLALATIEQSIVVQDQDAANRRDNGFTQTLTQDQIDALPDDPDEMAEELMRMAGPGAQIFVNGFRGGRMPPKDQIQQIRFHTNSFSSEYHEAGMIRVEVITKPGMGGWSGMTNFGFRDESLNEKNHFATEKGPEQMRRYMVNFQGPIAKGKTGLTVSFDGNSGSSSKPFDLTGGSYVVAWQASQRNKDACYVGARLRHVEDQNPGNLVMHTTLGSTKDRSSSGETRLTNVAPGHYVLDVMTTGCSWKMTLRESVSNVGHFMTSPNGQVLTIRRRFAKNFPV